MYGFIRHLYISIFRKEETLAVFFLLTVTREHIVDVGISPKVTLYIFLWQFSFPVWKNLSKLILDFWRFVFL